MSDLPCIEKGNIGGRKLKSQGTKILKNPQKQKLSFCGKLFLFYFFNENYFCFLILGEVEAKFIETLKFSMTRSRLRAGQSVVNNGDFIYFLLSGKGDNTIPESEIMFLGLRIPFTAPRIVLCTEAVLQLFWIV